MRISQAGLSSTRRSVLRNVVETRKSSGRSTMRGSVLHHSTGWPWAYHGKMPCRYAISSRCGERSALAASRPGASDSGPSARSTGGKGSCGSNQAIMVRAIVRFRRAAQGVVAGESIATERIGL
ncbi:protein of unknown function [Ralstonia solanacearum PSI07]|nr:protein of unknown function [Ralstonia solanacearum PSI07]